MTEETAQASPPPGEPVFVEVLTDEELSVLSRPGPMPVLPCLDQMLPRDLETARRTAYRSLVARGIVDPATPQAVAAAQRSDDGSVELSVRQDVASLVALREGARMVVALARTTAATQDFWYAHVVEDVVLLEEVSRDGFHRFALTRTCALSEATTAAAVHPEAADSTGAPEVMAAGTGDPTPPERLLEQLGAAFVRTDLIVRRVGDQQPPAFSVLSGPKGSWTLEPAGDEHPATGVLATPVSATQARARVTEAVDGVLAEIGVLHG